MGLTKKDVNAIVNPLFQKYCVIDYESYGTVSNRLI